jgi:hypothetical protein
MQVASSTPLWSREKLVGPAGANGSPVGDSMEPSPAHAAVATAASNKPLTPPRA